jgi:hypothetical protein
MTMSADQIPAGGREEHQQEHDMHDYAGGYIQAHHGGIPLWLLAVYVILLLWALFYAYVHWGSLGPGLAQ